MNIPTERQCFELLEKYKVPGNVVKHSMLVDMVAMHIGKKMAEKGVPINLRLLHAAALLHDIAKIQCLGKKEMDHAAEGRLLLEKEGFPEVGAVVETHMLSDITNNKTTTWERKILNYADKRAGDNIVSLEKRFAYIRKRYGKKFAADIDAAEPALKELEKEIFSLIGEKPDSVEKI